MSKTAVDTKGLTNEQILNAYRDAFDRLEARIAARFAAARRPGSR